MIFNDLYKFRTVNINSLAELSTRTIWFSETSVFNDPFEGLTKIIEPENQEELISKAIDFMTSYLIDGDTKLSKNDTRSIIEQKFSNDTEGTLKDIKQIVRTENILASEYAKKIGVFSTASDIPNYNQTNVSNMLLWSHYGGGFQGYAINYNAKELYNSLSLLNEKDSFAWATIDYVSQPLEIDPYIFQARNLEYIKSFQRKHEQWGYEVECRIICNKTGAKKFSKESIKDFYIGEKMPKNEEKMLINLIEKNYPDADIFKVYIDRNSYSVKVSKKA